MAGPRAGHPSSAGAGWRTVLGVHEVVARNRQIALRHPIPRPTRSRSGAWAPAKKTPTPAAPTVEVMSALHVRQALRLTRVGGWFSGCMGSLRETGRPRRAIQLPGQPHRVQVHGFLRRAPPPPAPHPHPRRPVQPTLPGLGPKTTLPSATAHPSRGSLSRTIGLMHEPADTTPPTAHRSGPDPVPAQAAQWRPAPSIAPRWRPWRSPCSSDRGGRS
jgi:hypothetical protein